MDEREVLDVLTSFPSLDARRAVPIGDGWSSDTFLVDDRWIFRFPRRDEIAATLDREKRLLPPLAEHVSFAVPRFEWFGEHRGWPFVGYERIAGDDVGAEDLKRDPGLASRLGLAVRELHGFDVARARSLLGDAGTVDSWKAAYEAFRTEMRERVVPLLDAGAARSLESEFERFLATVDFVPALVHRDLGVDHVLVDDGRFTGIIDFEEAAVGDPTIDFVGFLIELGPHWTQRIAGAHGISLDLSRLRFYVVLGAVHAVIYGLKTNDDELVRDAAANVGKRLARSV